MPKTEEERKAARKISQAKYDAKRKNYPHRVAMRKAAIESGYHREKCKEFKLKNPNYFKEWEAKNGKERWKIKGRFNEKLRKYGLTKQQYLQMFADQNNRCSICSVEFSTNTHSTRPCVDHCHSTRKVRSLLCNHCNSFIGYAREDQSVLLNAVEYLKRHNGG